MSEYLNLDCMDPERGLPSFPDNYFDLAIVDPPYGIGFDGENKSMSAGIRKDGTRNIIKAWKNRVPVGYNQKDWDDSRPTVEFFNALRRVSQFHIIWGGNYFSDFLPPSGGWVVWEKGVPDGMSLSQAELAWTNRLNSIKIAKHLWAGYKKCELGKRIHPTQKPVALYRWLLNNYAKPGMRLLDTHVGSASSLIAFEEQGFEYVAFEKDADYYRDSTERIANWRKQGNLFTPQEIRNTMVQKNLFEDEQF